jgi:hypothetical protein
VSGRAKTADGVEITVGMDVWAWASGDLCCEEVVGVEQRNDLPEYARVTLSGLFPRCAEDLYSTRLAALTAARARARAEVERLDAEIAKEEGRHA